MNTPPSSSNAAAVRSGAFRYSKRAPVSNQMRPRCPHATSAPFETEYRLRRADGRYRWHLVRACPMRDDDGAISGWVGAATDIDVTAVQVGANYWATKHIRLTSQYSLYSIARSDTLHEIGFRVGLAL